MKKEQYTPGSRSDSSTCNISKGTGQGHVLKTYGKVPEDPSTGLVSMPCGKIVNSPDEFLSKVRNDVVEKLNVPIQKQLLGQEYAYKSIDCILNDDEAVQHPIEFLNSIQTLDLQVHNLILKVGATIILIRNIDAPRLCRVIMKQLMQHVIQATVLT
ncbi:ATP-dependent DNA helicase [Trichonephila clavipes]|nr:ATP-dependent DNA helicase [Trichonephila clavipes]